MADCIIKIKENRERLGKLVLVSGDFNVLHPGHIRLLRFAKDCGDTLVVVVNGDKKITQENYHDQEHRLAVISSIACVDFSFASDEPIEQIIELLRPDIIVKGREHEHRYNPEQAAISHYGGKLVFSSGDTLQRTTSVFSYEQLPVIDVKKIKAFMVSHDIEMKDILDILQKFKQLNVAVVGDTIVDEYMQCNAVGMSQEDPTIVVTPDESKLFLGGAGITSAHTKALGAQAVSFLTIVGDDNLAKFALEKATDYQVKIHLFTDDTRPTTKKKRYRVGNKTLLRVNDFKEHDISAELQESILSKVSNIIGSIDLLVLSDFNYGVLPQPLVEKLISLCRQNGVFVAADSQTSSQVGDISRFQHVDLVTPTEREIRVALNNNRDGLIILTEKLHQKINCGNIVVTLADEGALLHIADKDIQGKWHNDKIPALASNPKDPAGAGDCLLAATAMSMRCGANLKLATLIGSIAAACQVSTVGNIPLDVNRLIEAIEPLG